MAITVGAAASLQPPGLCTKHSNTRKRLDFWESSRGRVGLGPGDGMRVFSGISQQPQPLSGYCLLAQMGSPGEAVSLARAPQLSGPSLALALSSSCEPSAALQSPRGSAFLLLCLIRARGSLPAPAWALGLCLEDSSWLLRSDAQWGWREV